MENSHEQAEEVQPQQQCVRLEIVLAANGELTVNGDIMHNKIIALGMLSQAVALVERFQVPQQGGVVIARGELPTMPNGLRRFPR